MLKLEAQRTAYGETLVELGNEIDNLVVMDADLAHATQTFKFAEKYKERFFNMGIAEQNMIGVASGLALSGYIPFVSTFALFGAGRAYEQIRNSVCYPRSNVKVAVTHGGISVGEDGGSHQSIEDIALMRVLPNMTVIVPCDAVETKKAVKAAAIFEGPVYIRIARSPSAVLTDENHEFKIGKGYKLREGEDISIFATGIMTAEAVLAAQKLAEDGISASVVNIHTIKPLDNELILAEAKKTGAVVTVEEHSIIGGLGGAISELLIGNGAIKMKRIGVEDRFGQSGDPESLLKEYDLTSDNIVSQCKKLLHK